MIASIIYNGREIPIGDSNTSEIKNDINNINTSIIDINNRLDNMNINFTDGCNRIVGALTSKGINPTNNTPSSISNAINEIDIGTPYKLTIDNLYYNSTTNIFNFNNSYDNGLFVNDNTLIVPNNIYNYILSPTGFIHINTANYKYVYFNQTPYTIGNSYNLNIYLIGPNDNKYYTINKLILPENVPNIWLVIGASAWSVPSMQNNNYLTIGINIPRGCKNFSISTYSNRKQNTSAAYSYIYYPYSYSYNFNNYINTDNAFELDRLYINGFISFNRRINIQPNMRNIVLHNLYNYNKPIIFPNNATNIQSLALMNLYNFNSYIVLTGKFTSSERFALNGMFTNCPNMHSNIYINDPEYIVNSRYKIYMGLTSSNVHIYTRYKSLTSMTALNNFYPYNSTFNTSWSTDPSNSNSDMVTYFIRYSVSSGSTGVWLHLCNDYDNIPKV